MDQVGISAVVPVYNLCPFVGEALASIRAQSRSVQEIIVVDDGSTDGTEVLVAELALGDPRFRILKSERLGPSGARNLGLNAATQPVIAFLDGDDVWPPDKIERQMRRLEAVDRPHAVSGLIRCFRELDPVSRQPIHEQGPIVPGAQLGATLFRRQVFERIGQFDESLHYSEDHDLMMRMREAGLKLAIIKGITLYYRRRAGSLTRGRDAPKDFQLFRVLRHSIARRRRKGWAVDLGPLTRLIDE